jgi:hypothetical protein
VGFVVDKEALRQVSSEYFGFACQSLDQMFYIHHLPLSGACTIGQIVTDITSGHSLTPPHENKKKIKMIASHLHIDHSTDLFP